MHFRHRLGKRAAAHAPFVAGATAALERAAVRTTYVLHDRILSNPSSRHRFACSSPSLDPAQRGVVEDLRTNGFAIRLLADLFSQQTWDELNANAVAWTAELERRLRAETVAEARARERHNEKAFLRRRYKTEPRPWRTRVSRRPDRAAAPNPAELTLASPWLRFAASERMLAIVDTYLGLWSKLSYVDQWHTPPQSADAERRGSMRWHRDFDDRHPLKVFVYLMDVDDAAGPFEYVPGSATKNPYANEWPWRPLGETYPPTRDFERRIPAAARRTFTAPAGSMIFCDTTGFHRGGFATDRARDLFVFNYVSPAALRSLVTRNYAAVKSAPGLSARQRFALT
jgi:hypothetical protein